MSRQIYFFHSECDAVHFIHEVRKNGGAFLTDHAVVPPESLESMILSKMSTYSCQFWIVPSGLADICVGKTDDSKVIEFDNCCKGNRLSRTYEVGRVYLSPNYDGNYTPELIELYESLRKYIKRNYFYKKEAGAYFAPDFWNKYCAHYYHATCAGRPVLI